MSYIYSAVLAEEYSHRRYSDTGLYAQSKTTPIVNLYCVSGRMTERSRYSRYGMTYELLTEQDGEELLSWFQEDFLVKTYPQPEKGKDLPEVNHHSGLKCYESFAKYDQNTSLWKIPQCLFQGDSIPYSAGFPKQGMMRNGSLWERTMSVQITAERGYGCLLPTPTVSGNHNRKGLSKNSGDGIATFVKKYPTPKATDAKNNDSASNRKRHQPMLATAVARFPTPGTTELSNGSGNCLKINKLYQAKIISEEERRAIWSGNGGRLNPEFVEWLMGWIIGLTGLKPLETDKCRSVRQWRSVFCGDE